jgi:type VI secretion system secreted protein Hcp
MPIYMKIEGVDGSVTNQFVQHGFDIMAFSWGESQTGSTTGGGGAGRVNMADFSMMKQAGKGTAGIMLACATGRHLPAVQLTVTIGREGREVIFQQYRLEDCLVSSFQTSGDGGSVPTESLSLNFTKIEFRQAVLSATGQTQFEGMNWDQANNTGGGGGG